MPLISAVVVRAALQQMKRRPCIELYTGDWLQDDITNCSSEAERFWFRAMFAMHVANPYGHMVASSGKPLSDEEIVRKTGVKSLILFKKILKEIEEKGIPGRTGDAAYRSILNTAEAVLKVRSKEWTLDLSPLGLTDDGVLYSRRMLRDRRLSVVRFFASPKGQLLIRQTGDFDQSKVAALSTTNSRAYVEDEEEVGSKSESRDQPGRVQGGVLTPDFEEIRRAVEKIDASALQEHPPDQIVAAWFSDGIDGELIQETLADCENEYRGKHWRYLEKILKTRRDNPDQRPKNRRARSGNGNGNDDGNRSGDRPGRRKPPINFA